MGAVTPMSPDGLVDEWDLSPVIRARILAGNMMEKGKGQSWCIPNRDNAKLNKDVLLPCLRRLSEVPDYHLPHLPPLQVQIAKLFTQLGKDVNEKQVYQSAVEIKKLLSFVKRRVTHKEVTKDQCSQISINPNVLSHPLFSLVFRNLV